MAISSYSLIALTNALDSLFQEKKTSITALSFIGSQQVVSGYGVMSVAKAALESTALQLAHSLVFLMRYSISLMDRDLEAFE